MSSEEEDEVEVVPLPPHRIRFTDMEWALVDKAIRLVEESTHKCKIDKDLSTEIQRRIKADKDLQDDTAGWHIVCGKSYASAITYKTTSILFFDLLEGHHKTFLMFKTQ